MYYQKFFDVSLALHSEIPVWPGDPTAEVIPIESLTKGDTYNYSLIHAPLHWGTHIDAPYHFNQKGWTVDQIPLEILIGSARVIEIPDCAKISSNTLKKYDLTNTNRILFKTKNSEFWKRPTQTFQEDFCALTIDAAEYLLKHPVKLIGIDYYSLDLYESTDMPVHKMLFRNNVVGLENIDLREISPGIYQMVCLPIKIKNGDGAPARVILYQFR